MGSLTVRVPPRRGEAPPTRTLRARSCPPQGDWKASTRNGGGSGGGKSPVQYFPVRAVCKVIGIGARSQLDRLRFDSAFSDPDGLRTIPCPTARGLRDTLCIKRTLAVNWLSLVNPNNCGIPAGGPLERFREELFAAAGRLLFGDVSDLSLDDGGRPVLPLYGVIHLGNCPRCWLHLKLEMDIDGPHLAADDEE